MEFKDRIRELREKKGMIASTLAANFGKSEGAVRAWEAGRTKPDADTLIKLAKLFEVSTDYLLGVVDAKKPKNTILVKELGLSDSAIATLRTFATQKLVFGSHSDKRTLLEIQNQLFCMADYDMFLMVLAALSHPDSSKEESLHFTEATEIKFPFTTMLNSWIDTYIKKIADWLRTSYDGTADDGFNDN
jgi:transcriptional regulator with XRE-family HTH domain